MQDHNPLTWFFKTLMIFTLLYPAVGMSQTLAISAPTVFDGEQFFDNYTVVVERDLIIDIGPSASIQIPSHAIEYTLEGMLMPGMIEGHSHILLHPYDETSWNDQVLKESFAERALRAGNHVQTTILAGITTMRDLGSEGAEYLDVGIKESIEKGIIDGPTLIVAGPAIVATGSYGPKGFASHVKVPLGANQADGYDDLVSEVRRQIGGGADIIKVYADYRWGPEGEAMPTFTIEELKTIVSVAKSSGRPVVAHAATAEGMRRATLAGVATIEHGDGGTREVFELMKKHKVALCPTLAAGHAIMQYRGWDKESEKEPDRIKAKRKSFALALEVGVSIVAGGDVGVFPHGENVREFEMMVDYGMSEREVLVNITSKNADLLGLPNLGRLKIGMKADIIQVGGDPRLNIANLYDVGMVMKNGEIIKNN